WEAEEPRTVFVAFDTLTVPTYRHELLAEYQSGRDFPRDLTDQLAKLPDLVDALGFAWAKEAGYEADDFLGAAAAAEEKTKRPPPLPARSPREDDPPPQARRVRASARRARGGAGALGGGAAAGPGLHRAPRRPLGPDPRRAGSRAGARGRDREEARVSRGGAR